MIFLRRVLLVFFLAVHSVTLLAASSANPERRDVRAELNTFFDDLGSTGHFAPVQIENLRAGFATLKAEDLDRFAAATKRFPQWRALPEVLSALDAQEEEQQRLMLERIAQGPPQTAVEELESFRGHLLFFINRLAVFSPLVDKPVFDKRINSLRYRIATLPTEDLPHLQRAFYTNAPIWKAALAGMAVSGPGGLTSKDLDLSIDFGGVSCDLGCGSACSINCEDESDLGCDTPCCEEECVGPVCVDVCDPICLGCVASEETCLFGCTGVDTICSAACGTAEGLCGDLNTAITEIVGVINTVTGFISQFFLDIAGVFSEIEELPGIVEGFFVQLFTDLETTLTGVVEQLLEPIDELLNIGSLEDALALLGLDGLNASFFEDLAQNAPSLLLACPNMGVDIPGIGEVGSIRAEYACKRGIDWVSHLIYDVVPDDVLDIPLKIPATILYYPINYFCLCMEAQSGISFADAQAAHRADVVSRLDAVLSTRASQASVDTLLNSVGGVQGQADTLSSSVADAQSTVDDVDGDVAAVEAKLDILDHKADQIDQSQDIQLALAEDFQDLVLRLRIEEDLIRNRDDAVALFQLPEALGGVLETVRAIVVDTIAINEAVGRSSQNAERELAKGDRELARGEFERAYEHFRKAYSEAVK